MPDATLQPYLACQHTTQPTSSPASPAPPSTTTSSPPPDPSSYGFRSDEEGTNLLNLVKTAFLDALMLMLHGLPHADQGTPTFYRYFDQGDECDVKRILAHFLGNGQGLDAIRDPDKPLRIVWLDATLVRVPADQNRCLKEGAVAA